ncbi:MAG: hypothetical protein AAFO79_03480 [Pseudomonadota bacterium]
MQRAKYREGSKQLENAVLMVMGALLATTISATQLNADKSVGVLHDDHAGSAQPLH